MQPTQFAVTRPHSLAAEGQISCFSQNLFLVELGFLLVKSDGKEQGGICSVWGSESHPAALTTTHLFTHLYGALTPRKASAVLAVGRERGTGMESCWSGPRPLVTIL